MNLIGYIGRIVQTTGGCDWLIYLDGRHTNQETGGMEASFNEPSSLLLYIRELLIIYSVLKGSSYCKNVPIVPLYLRFLTT